MTAGDHTDLLATRATPPRRGFGLGWLAVALLAAASALGGWLLWERGRLAADQARDARRILADANQRAAAAEDRLLALGADQLRAPPAATPVVDLAPLAASLRAALDRQAGAVTLDAGGRVVVVLDDPDLFRGDDAELSRRGEYVVDHLSPALADAGDHTLWVGGHVDDAPLPDDAPFASAWDLSAARALAVVQRLRAHGVDPRRMVAVAFGAERPRGPDRAKNRRIELVVGDAPVFGELSHDERPTR